MELLEVVDYLHQELAISRSAAPLPAGHVVVSEDYWADLEESVIDTMEMNLKSMIPRIAEAKASRSSQPKEGGE